MEYFDTNPNWYFSSFSHQCTLVTVSLWPPYIAVCEHIYFHPVVSYGHPAGTFFLSGRQHIDAHALCMQHSLSNCCGALDFLSPEPCPLNSLKLIAFITRFSESYSTVSISHESKRLKKARNNWLNSGNALTQHLSEKNASYVFPRFAR